MSNSQYQKGDVMTQNITTTNESLQELTADQLEQVRGGFLLTGLFIIGGLIAIAVDKC
jgi:lactobin A/cerein 7B family class IIb bacteriocin